MLLKIDEKVHDEVAELLRRMGAPSAKEKLSDG